MNNYKKRAVDSEVFKELVEVQLKNKTPIKMQTNGSRNTLYIGNKMSVSSIKSYNLDLGELPEKMFYSFLGGFSKHLYKQFHKNESLYDLKIKFKGASRHKNKQFWETLDNGRLFYNLDLSSAYWQMAYRLGYISEKYFNDYQDADSYKQAKRYCISFLGRTNKMQYINPNETYTIECNTEILKQVYDNIRNELYLCIQKSMEGISNYIEFNIDGVSVMATDVDIVKANMLKLGLKFKLTRCQKISNKEYIYNFYKRTF